MRILIVEDEPLLASRLAATCGERGYVVDIAADGERADFLVSWRAIVSKGRKPPQGVFKATSGK
jgi:DNA-binding response OmpR family regulator